MLTHSSSRSTPAERLSPPGGTLPKIGRSARTSGEVPHPLPREKFDVEVRERGGQTRHRVTMSQATYAKLSGGRAGPGACIEAAFAFLLDREPKESILARFDVTVISRYYPEFEREIGRYRG